MIGRWAVGVVLLFVILLSLLPSTDEQSLARIGSASMLACTKPLREQVAQQVLAGEPVSAVFNNDCPDLIAALELDERGGMVISGNKHAVTMRLQPLVEQGAVRWSCTGEPPESVTSLCRP